MNFSEPKKPIIAIILYKPEQLTYERIEAAINAGYNFYIFDNTLDEKSRSFAHEFHLNIKYFTLNKNIGIGPALKIMCSSAFCEGNQYLLYFDQDTIYNKDTLDFIDDYITVSSEKINSEEEGKIASVTFRDSASNKSKKCLQKVVIGKFELNIVDLTINSGTLFYLNKLKNIGWHDGSYTIDGVDYYICLAAKAAGFKVAEIYNAPGLDHNREQGTQRYKFLSKKFDARRYPIERIKDYLKSSFKLIIKSAPISIPITFRMIKLLISYLMIQFFVYISNKEK